MSTQLISKQEFDSLSRRVEKLEALLTTSPEKFSNKKMSLNEFLNKYSPKSHLERYAAFMLYSKNEGVDAIDGKEVGELYRRSKTKQPKNLSDVKNQLERKGWIDSNDSNKKTFHLTQTGLDALNLLLQNKDK